MTHRPTRLILVTLLLLTTTPTLAQRSSSSPSQGGHSSPSPNYSPPAPSYSPPASSAPSAPTYTPSPSSPPSSNSGGGSASHSNSSGASSSHSDSSSGNAHSGGVNHSGGNSNHSNPTPGGSSAGGNHNSDVNHGGRSNSSDVPHSNRINRPGSRPDANPGSFEAGKSPRGNTDRRDSARNNRSRTPDANHRQPGTNETSLKQPTAEHSSRMSRIFHFWRHSPKNPEHNELAKRGNPDLKRPNPCKGVNCKPVCLPGQSVSENGTCAPAPKRPDNSLQCPTGTYALNGSCQPTEYDYSASVRNSGCTAIETEIDALVRQLNLLYESRSRECARDPNGAACGSLTNQIADLEQSLTLLRQQYAACLRSHP